MVVDLLILAITAGAAYLAVLWIKMLVTEIVLLVGDVSSFTERYSRKFFYAAMGWIMSSYKKSVVCDALYDTILTLSANRVLSFKDERDICEKIAKALDMPELLPRDVYRVWISARLHGKPKMTDFVRPNKPKWGEHTGQVYIPAVEQVDNTNVSHAFLQKLRERNAA